MIKIYFQGFLLLTIAVYAALPSLQNLPGKIVLSNVIAVTATTIVLLINYGSMNFKTIPCKILGHLVCYFGISMFCWMTVMCFDLCTVFLKSMAMPHIGKTMPSHIFIVSSIANIHSTIHFVF